MAQYDKNRRIAFDYDSESKVFESGLGRFIQGAVKIEREKLLPPENTEGYSHGIRWATYSGSDPGETNLMESHTHEELIKFSDIVENRVSALHRFIGSMVIDMVTTLQKMMYQTITESTNKTGNVVSAAGNKTNAEAFLEMIEKIEFGVDRDGNPTMPEIHMAPEMADKFMKELDEQDDDYRKQVQDIQNKKSEDAIKRERERVSKFK